MRTVSWNLGYMTPATYKSPANRERQWRFLDGLEPDLMLIQECRPADLELIEDGLARYRVIGDIPRGWFACSVVVAKHELAPLAVPKTGRLLEALAGYVTPAKIETAEGPLLVASVHAPARPLTDPPLSNAEHATLRRLGAQMGWYNDVAFAALDALPKENGFMFGGDWNTAHLFDTNYPLGAEGGATAAQFFERAAERGWVESMKVSYPKEVRTFLRANSAPYQNDRVFTDSMLHQRLVSCQVFETVDGVDAVEVSDHAPIMLEFDVKTAA